MVIFSKKKKNPRTMLLFQFNIFIHNNGACVHACVYVCVYLCNSDICVQITMTPFYCSNLKGHCIEFKYYADGIHSGLTPPG